MFSHAKIFMMHATFPVATAATYLTGTSSRATSLQANEYTLMDSAHSSNKCEILPTDFAQASATFVRSPTEPLLLAHHCPSENFGFFFFLAS